MIPPPNKSPDGQHNNQGRNYSGHKGRGRGRGRGKGRGPSNGPKKFFCHFHGSDSDHTTNFYPEKKRTLERMEEEKKAKLVSHTAWLRPSAPPFPPTSNLYNPTYQPSLAFTYNTYPNNWPPQPQAYPKPLPLPPPPSQQQAQEELPPPPSGPPPKQEPQSSQTSQTSALPSFGMIMPISGGSTLEF